MAFRKIDLHIHTPASSCYLDHVVPEAQTKSSPQDIVDAAIRAGLDAIAITDHNTVVAVGGVMEAAGRNGLCVFPGVELSCRGGHVLAIYPREASLSDIHHVISYLGISPEQEGLGYVDSACWMDEAFALIEQSGGLAIAAHIDRRPKGFIAAGELSREDKKRIYMSEYLRGLEITLPQDKPLWNRGEMPFYPRGYPCIQASDAHAPAEIGRRPLYVDMQALSLEELRLALGQHEGRVRFPQEMEKVQHRACEEGGEPKS